MQCTPNTSSESSYPNLPLSQDTAQRQISAAMAPMAIEPIVPTHPQAGVIATSPATAPDAAPSIVGEPLKIHSPNIQAMVAAAVASRVLVNTSVAKPLASRLVPTLKPNQPTHSSAEPTMT